MADLLRKMASNKKMQENKPTLKFNFTIEKRWPVSIFELFGPQHLSHWALVFSLSAHLASETGAEGGGGRGGGMLGDNIGQGIDHWCGDSMTASDLPARQCPSGQSASTVDFNQESSHSLWRSCVIMFILLPAIQKMGRWITKVVDHKGCRFTSAPDCLKRLFKGKSPEI